MIVPLEFLYGIDVAVKKLRPGAKFQISGNTFTEWDDPTGENPPNWDEVMSQLQTDQQAYETWQKQQNT
jgi:hypothetical protein